MIPSDIKKRLLDQACRYIDRGLNRKALDLLTGFNRLEPACAAARVLTWEAKVRLKYASAIRELDTAYGLNAPGLLDYLMRVSTRAEMVCAMQRGPASPERRQFLLPHNYGSLISALTLPAGKTAQAPAWVYFTRGEARTKIGDLKRSVQDFSRALFLEPRRPKTLACRGEARSQLGDIAGALADFRAALKLAPGSDWLLAWRGRINLWAGNQAQGLKDLNSALKINPRYAWAHSWKGAAYLNMNDLKGALKHLDRALALDPDDAEARIWRGEVLRRSGRPGKALEDLERILRRNPRNTEGLFSHFLALTELGDKAGAEKDLRLIRLTCSGFLRKKTGTKRTALYIERLLRGALEPTFIYSGRRVRPRGRAPHYRA